MLTDSGPNVDEPGSSDSSDGTFVKPIIASGIISVTFIAVVGAIWVLLHRNNYRKHLHL